MRRAFVGPIVGLVLLIATFAASRWLTRSPSAACDLSKGSCRMDLGDGRAVEVAVTPRPVPTVTPMTVEARFSGARPTRAELVVTGVTMAMGVTKIPLRGNGAGAFIGKGALPVCVYDSFLWDVELQYELDGVRGSARMQLETSRSAKPSAPLEDQVAAMNEPPVDFTLTSAKGPVQLSDFRGKAVLLYFGYTFCPDVCPTSLGATSRVLKSLSPTELEQVQAMFVSVDPARDSPEQLAEYVRFFHPSMVGVTGTDAEVAAAARHYGVIYAKHQEPDSSHYSVDHSTYSYLIAPDGHLAARLPHAAPVAMVRAELAKWISLDPTATAHQESSL